MNRATAILLLPIMLIFAIQPVIAMHYCAGELQSLNLFSQQPTPANSPSFENINENQHGCCNQLELATQSHLNEWNSIGGECCNTQLLTLSTDDYQNKVENSTQRTFTLSLLSIGFNLLLLQRLVAPILHTHTAQLDFPVDGLFLKNLNLLTYICIFRI